MGSSVTGASYVKVNRNMRGFMNVLTSAACEWFLIFLLFIDALLSYLLIKFASYCKLQTPCLLCSRLDHVFGDEKPEFYRTLLCTNHKSEISSLISCQIHGNLADSYGMCEDCLLSFSKDNKSISESHRLLGAKMGFNLINPNFQNPLLNKEFGFDSSGTKNCSCCNKLWSSRQNLQSVFQIKSTGNRPVKPNIPLPRLPSRKGFNRRDSLKRMRAKFYGSVTSHDHGNYSFGPLSEVGYTELKITSDSESEVPFSDDDDGISLMRENHNLNREISSQRSVNVSSKASCDNLALEPLVQIDVSDTEEVKCSSSDILDRHGLNDLKWQQEINTLALPELISFDDLPKSVNIMEAHVGASTENYLIEVDDVGTSMNGKALISSKGPEFKSNQVSEDPITSNLDYPDQSMSPKSIVNNPLEEQNTSEINNETSPRSQFYEYERQNSDYHNYNRDGSSIESLDGSAVSDIDGESVVDRLKRQVEYDKKCMNSLYKELEEERNASAIAANQAMAMITRLQEEKASLHMESLQYLRMMEEQAEYDVEALEKANDLLAEKEKEMQDLEAELEFYRIRYNDDDLTVENLPVENTFNGGDSKKKSFEFEDEKVYILESLKKLEEKIHEVRSNEVSSIHMPNGEYNENVENIANGFDNHEDESRPEINHIGSNGKKSCVNFVALESEVIELNERLKALEENRDFLERALNTLQNGKDGVQFLQEITHQLQELTKIGVKRSVFLSHH